MTRFQLIFCALLITAPALRAAAPLVYEGESGLGKGKHIVFIASDHEYRSEETLPALARILAKHHGFKCSVVFGVHPDGRIRPGYSNVPGIEALADADLLVLFTRFQDWPDEQMQHFVNYLDRGGPIVGLRTATHGFQIKSRRSKWYKYSNGSHLEGYEGGFGRQVLGEKWAGHYGSNHRMSTRLDIAPEEKDHPILKGVKSMWAACGGYQADPLPPSKVLATAQPLKTMEPDGPAEESMPPVPAAWTRNYKGKDGAEGRVFTCTYGASNDIVNDGTRRMFINACIWGCGLEHLIAPDLDVSFVGPYNPTWSRGGGKRKHGIRPEDLAGWDSPIVPLEE